MLSPPAEPTAAPTEQRAPTLAAASLGFAVVQLDVFVVNVGVKQIGDSLGAGTTGLQWVVGAYTLLFAACILTAGAFGDRFGARRTYMIGFGLFAAASVGCALAPDVGVLVAGRALQGVGAAIIGACSLALLNHAFTERTARVRAIGLWAAGASVALSAGPIVGGLLIASAGWRSIFFINLPLVALGIFLTWRTAEETPRNSHPVDVTGQVAAVVGLAALAGGLIEGGALGFADPVVALLVAGGLAALALFVCWEAHTGHPMLPLSLFGQADFAAPALLGLLVNVAFYGLIFVLSLYFQRVQGASALRAGLLFVPMTAVVLVTNLLSGRLEAVIGTRRVIWCGLAGMAAGCAGLLVVAPTTPFSHLVVQLVLLGGGLGLLVPPMTGALMGSVDRARSGVASGTLNTSRQSGSVLGVAVFGSLVAGQDRFVAGFHTSLVISLGLVAVAAGVTSRISGRRV
jgi:MFS transporter, DHA2 family, methylenomycin A resistance protein